MSFSDLSTLGIHISRDRRSRARSQRPPSHPYRHRYGRGPCPPRYHISKDPHAEMTAPRHHRVTGKTPRLVVIFPVAFPHTRLSAICVGYAESRFDVHGRKGWDVLGSRCGVPECQNHAVKEWDTVRNRPADAHTFVPIPVCELHYWILDNGGRLTLKFRG